MTVQDETTRTPNSDGGDAGANTQTTGTQGEDGRNAQSSGGQEKEHLVWKDKAEKLNAMLAAHGVSTVEELNEKLAQSPAAPAETRTEPEDDDEADERAAQEFAAKGDPVAKLALRLARRNRELVRGVGDAFTVRDISDPAERKAALAHYQKNQHRLGDVNAALAEIRAPKLAAENAKLAAELAKLKKAPDPDVVNAPPTHGREITSNNTTKRKMTGAQFDAEVAALHAQGKSRSALDLRRAYAEGNIVISG